MAEDLLEEKADNGEEMPLDGDFSNDGDMDSGTLSKKKNFLKKMMGNKKRLLVMGGIGILVMGFLVAGAWFFLGSDQDEKDAAKEPGPGTEEGTMATPAEPVFEDIVAMEPFDRIPLKAGSAMGHISLDVSLELTDPAFRKQVFVMEERIRKIIISQVREMEWLELRSPQGKLKLKYSLLGRVNKIFPTAMVHNIYFSNFIMQ